MAAFDAGVPAAGPLPLRRRQRADTARPRPDTVARAGLFVWTPVGLAVGIGAWFALPIEPGPDVYAILAAVVMVGAWAALGAVAWAEAGRIAWGTAAVLRTGGFALALIAAGGCLAGARLWRVDAPVMAFRYYGAIEGRVVQIDRSARDRMRLTLDRVVLARTSPDRTPARVRLSLTRLPSVLPSPGQRVMTTGHLGPPPGPTEPGGFDFRQSAYFARLGAVGYTRNPVMTVAPPQQGGAMALHRLRMRTSAAIMDRIGGQPGAVAAALTTGDRSGIAEATNQTMRDSNLYHIISISGLHMGMLAGFVYAAMRLALIGAQAVRLAPAGPPLHKLAAAVALLAAAAYLWLSGGGVATERAFIMVAVMLGAVLADRRAISLRTVALAATLILAVSPEALVSPGFQMSFAATVALILTARPWARIAPRIPWFVRPVAMLVVTSFVAGVATGPIAAAHFSRSAQYGLLANLLAVPVMGTLVMPAGVIAALLAPLGLAGPALWVMGLGTRWMLAVAAWISGLGGAVVAVPAAPAWALPLIGLGTVVAVLTLRPGARPAALRFGSAGCAALIAGIAMWITAPRPDLLIAPEGGAVGILTAQGRTLSKPANAFIADSWLEADGDTATAVDAAARPGWSGAPGVRTTRLGDTPIIHLTGKTGAAQAVQSCAQDAVVISDTVTSGTNGCQLFDLGRLRRTGSVAGYLGADGIRWITTAERAGQRRWTDHRPRRPRR